MHFIINFVILELTVFNVCDYYSNQINNYFLNARNLTVQTVRRLNIHD